MTDFNCAGCGAKLVVDDSEAVGNIQCPDCGRIGNESLMDLTTSRRLIRGVLQGGVIGVLSGTTAMLTYKAACSLWLPPHEDIWFGMLLVILVPGEGLFGAVLGAVFNQYRKRYGSLIGGVMGGILFLGVAYVLFV